MHYEESETRANENEFIKTILVYIKLDGLHVCVLC